MREACHLTTELSGAPSARRAVHLMEATSAADRAGTHPAASAPTTC